jgi:hypothetical protein
MQESLKESSCVELSLLSSQGDEKELESIFTSMISSNSNKALGPSPLQKVMTKYNCDSLIEMLKT